MIASHIKCCVCPCHVHSFPTQMRHYKMSIFKCSDVSHYMNNYGDISSKSFSVDAFNFASMASVHVWDFFNAAKSQTYKITESGVGPGCGNILQMQCLLFCGILETKSVMGMMKETDISVVLGSKMLQHCAQNVCTIEPCGTARGDPRLATRNRCPRHVMHLVPSTPVRVNHSWGF